MSNMISGVVYTPLAQTGEGPTGTTYTLPIARMGDFLLCYRKAGSLSGRHYHEGISPQKNPEILIVTQGEAEFYLKNLQTGEEMRERWVAPFRLDIGPHIWHEVTAITDIAFIELNTLEQHKADTKYSVEG